MSTAFYQKGQLIGLTGPTGAGKSTVCTSLMQRGWGVVDADATARLVTQPGQPCLVELAEAFGKDILTPDGALRRAVLADRAFSSPQDTQRLNAITHPHILRRIKEEVGQLYSSGKKLVALDAPLLFESGLAEGCAATVAVLAPAQQRLARIMQRDNITQTAAQKRMSAQPDDQFYLARASYVLYNTGNSEALYQQAQQLAAQLEEAYGQG